MIWVLALSVIFAGIAFKKFYKEYCTEGFEDVPQTIGKTQLYLMLAMNNAKIIDGLSRDHSLAESYVYRALGSVEKWNYSWTEDLEAVYRVPGSPFVYDAILGVIDVNTLDDEAYLIGYWGDTEYALVQVAASLDEAIELAKDHLGNDIQLEYNGEYKQWEGKLENLLVTVKLHPAEPLKILAAYVPWRYSSKAYYMLSVRVIDRIETNISKIWKSFLKEEESDE